MEFFQVLPSNLYIFAETNKNPTIILGKITVFENGLNPSRKL